MLTDQGADRLFTQEEVADTIRIAAGTLKKWRSEGKGPKFIKVSNRVLYYGRDIRTFVDACAAGES